MTRSSRRYVGTAGWTIPRAVADQFPAQGSSLERYAAVFGAAEINSSFHRNHRASTWIRWAQSVPEEFRFAVKLPKTITHQAKLQGVDALLDAFHVEASLLGARLGPLLVQLPPSLAFDAQLAHGFFAALAARFDNPVACEPRHPSWFAPEAEALLVERRVGRVAADPARTPTAAEPGGWPGLVYLRLHGSPRTYYSAYGAAAVEAIAERLRASAAAESWCIFDNTASGAAAADALALRRALAG